MLAKTFPIALSVKNAFVDAWHNRMEWLKIGLTPTVMQWIVSFLFVSYHMPEVGEGEGGFSSTWLAVLLSLMIWVMFAVKSYRYVILGEKVKGWFYVEWKRSHWRMLGYWTLLMIGWVAAIVFFMGLVFLLLTLGQPPETLSDTTQFEVLFLSGAFVFFVGVYILYRLGFLSSALVISHDAPIRDSLKKTQGLNWLRLMACGFLIMVPFFIFRWIFDVFEGEGLLISHWITVLSEGSYDEKIQYLAVLMKGHQPSFLQKYLYDPLVYLVRGIVAFQLYGSVYKELDQK